MAVDDVLKDRQALEEWFDKIVIGMAYANGSFDDNVMEIVKNAELNMHELLFLQKSLTFRKIGL